ncbi:sensor histidine kinase [Roseomonas sp. WA12]
MDRVIHRLLAEKQDGHVSELTAELVEVVHRAGNDLGAVMTMLHLQSRAVEDPSARLALNAVQDRAMAMIRVNARLDGSATGVTTLMTITAPALVSGLVEDFQAVARGRPIVLEAVLGPSFRIPVMQARPLGLIANEWVTNALGFAFPDNREGTICIGLSCWENVCTLTVSDDGVGLNPASPPKGTGIGTRLVKALAEQLHGRTKVHPRSGGGTVCSVTFRSPDPD